MTKRLAPLLLALLPAAASANIDIVFDYSYDTSGFFNDATRKNLLESAASVFESRITDNLGAITSGGDNLFQIGFYNPSSADSNSYINDAFNIPALNSVSIAANEYRIYVGGAALAGSTLGQGAPGGFAISTTDDANGLAFEASISRGQAGYMPFVNNGANDTDFGHWGGSIAFNSGFASWYFDANPGTTEGFSGYDFYSVALHEIAHVLGVGTADSWINKVNGLTFTGPNSGTQSLADKAHWAESTTSPIDGAGSFETAMDPSIGNGSRKQFTDLDWNGLRDIGWQVTAVPEADTWALLLAGLGLVGMAARRRRA